MAENAQNAICRHTRLSIPECCCQTCLRAHILAHSPQTLASGEQRLRTLDPGLPERRAA